MTPLELAALAAFLIMAATCAHAQQPGDTIVVTIPGTSVSFTLAYVPGGSFRIGSPESEPGRAADEGPQRAVTVDAFWMGLHEVTHDQYAVFRNRRLDSEATAVPGTRFDVDAVSRPSPPYEDPAHGMGTDGYPAAGITQWAALQYARWISLKTGRLFRLPTEAEWEYACRAGTETPWPFGSDVTQLGNYAWFAENAGDKFQRIARKRPNQWGLHDMLGNVGEWTLDQYDPAFYGKLEDGAASPWSRPTGELPHTVRGGAFDDAPAGLRCAERLSSTPQWQRRDPQLPRSRWWNTDSPHVGFRLMAETRNFTIREIEAFWDGLIRTPGDSRR